MVGVDGVVVGVVAVGVRAGVWCSGCGWCGCRYWRCWCVLVWVSHSVAPFPDV